MTMSNGPTGPLGVEFDVFQRWEVQRRALSSRPNASGGEPRGAIEHLVHTAPKRICSSFALLR